jgi:hypothetical protein
LTPGLTELFERANSPDRIPQAVTLLLDSLTDDVEITRPLLRLIRYLPIEPIRILFDKLRLIIEHKECHLEIIGIIYDEGCSSDPPENIFKELAAVYKEDSEDDSSLAIYAPLAAVASDYDILDEIINPRSPLRVQIALKSCEYMANDNVSLDFEPSEDVLDTILELLHDSMIELRTSAFSCLSSLIENDVFIEPDDIEELLATFPEILVEDYPTFFKLLQTLINVDELDHLSLEKVVDFAYLNLRVHNRLIRDSLKILKWTAEAEESYVKCVVDDILPFALQLLDSSNEKEFGTAVNSILLYLSLEPEAVIPFVDLNKLLHIAETHENERIKGKAGILFAALETRTGKDESVRIIDDFVCSKSLRLIRSAGEMGRFFRTSSRVYQILSQAAMTIRDSKVLDTLLIALRQCLKVKLPGCDGIELAKTFLSGTHPIFNRKPPAAFHNRKSQIYRFLALVQMPEVERTLLNWFTEAPFPMMGSHLEAISKLTFSTNLYALWVKTFTRKMANSTPYLNEIMLGFVMKIIRIDHSSIDIDFLVSQLTYFLEEVNDEELGWRAALGTAILELCAFGAEMDEDVIQEVLSSYPFAAHFGKTREATVAMIVMVNSGQWDEIKAAVAVSFTQALTMSMTSLKDHDIGIELRNEMLEMTTTIFNEDQRIRKGALEAFKGKSIRVKRFAALFGE